MASNALSVSFVWLFMLTHAAVAQDASPISSIDLTITDESGVPLKGAEAQVLKWTGTYDPVGQPYQTDGSGRALCTFPHTDNHFSIKVAAPDFAIALSSLQVDAGERKQLALKLSRPVSGFIEVNAGDQPVEGAELSWLQYIDANMREVYMNKSIAQTLGIDWPVSDSAGKLKLPPVPAGCKLTLKVIHPKWRQARMTGVVSANGHMGSMELKAGVAVQLNISQVDGAPSSAATLDGTEVDVAMLGDSGSSAAETVIHRFEIKNGQVEFTAHDLNYHEIRLRLKDFFASPYLSNYPDAPDARLDLKNAKGTSIGVTLIPKRKARGRIVDRDGKGIEGAGVYGSIARPDRTEESAASIKTGDSDSTAQHFAKHWTLGGNADSDKDGNFTIELARGRARLEVIKEGYFGTPVQTEFTWSGELDDSLSPIAIYQVPTVRGLVHDAAGRARSGMVVRMKHKGSGDDGAYAITDDAGNFELKISRLPYSLDGKTLLTEVYVLAFDPHSNEAGLAQINAKDPASTNDLVIALSKQKPGWILKPLGDVPKSADELAWKKVAAEEREKYAEGAIGKAVPDMHEGSWFNTEAKSLKDFRGQYVLLDFWFIGCGPCFQDMPTVKAAYQAYKAQGFTVVSVHDNSQNVEEVKAFAAKHKLAYPIIVDNTDGEIVDQYKPIGLRGFPSYILLGPDGKILLNDAYLFDSDSLRGSKLELIHTQLHRTEQP